MTKGHQLFAALTAEAKRLNRKLTGPEVIAVLDGQLGEPKKKKADFDDRAQNIFNLYPNRQGGTAALKAITESIAEDGFEMVLGRTTEYANAVARWPRFYRYSQNPDNKGRDLVPMASTWFNQRRYRDDPQTWARVGNSPPPKPKENLQEPEGWRFAHSQSRFVVENIPWNQIDTPTQQYIIDHTPKQNTA